MTIKDYRNISCSSSPNVHYIGVQSPRNILRSEIYYYNDSFWLSLGRVSKQFPLFGGFMWFGLSVYGIRLAKKLRLGGVQTYVLSRISLQIPRLLVAVHIFIRQLEQLSCGNAGMFGRQSGPYRKVNRQFRMFGVVSLAYGHDFPDLLIQLFKVHTVQQNRKFIAAPTTVHQLLLTFFPIRLVS